MSSLSTYINVHGMREHPVDGDGHCILHSVSGALRMTTGTKLSTTQLLEKVVDEVCQHVDYYQEFSSRGQCVVAQVAHWAIDKDYNMDAIDLIPNIV